MAVVVKTKKGKKRILLNPSEKSKRYARQLKRGSIETSNGEIKELTRAQASFRMGYLKARKDNAKAYKHNKKKYNS